MNLQWQSSDLLSCLHAAWCGVHWSQRARHLSQDMRAAAIQLQDCLVNPEQSGMEAEDGWQSLCSLAAGISDSSTLADRFVQLSAVQPCCDPSSLRGALHKLTEAFHDGFPSFQEEMSLRTGPIRQQWEAYGPGLLNVIRGLLGLERQDDAASVFLVQPILGGYGQAYPRRRCISLEAVLTNREPTLPETLRMAWLLSQLRVASAHADSKQVATNWDRVRSLATIPATLQAGAELGIAEYSVDSCEASISAWQADLHLRSIPASLPESLMAWWEEYTAQAMGWNQACQKLRSVLNA